MTDLRRQLRDALGEEEYDRLPVDEAAAIRRLIVASVSTATQPRRPLPWLQPLAVAATLVAMIAAGIAIGQRLDRAGIRAISDTNGRSSAREPEGGRQLHFSTPGGTRIIWIFNADLDLKTMP